MNAHDLRRGSTAIGGLAMLAAALTPLTADAAETEPAGPHNEQVALVNETGAQPQGTKSRISGTGQVASRDGSSIVFSTDAALVPWDKNDTDDVYLRSRSDGFVVLVSARGQRVGNDASFEPTISNDGRWVAYTTYATNLVRGTGGEAIDVVVRDMHSTRTRLVSADRQGDAGRRNSFSPVISGNGRFVSFQTFSRLGPKDQDRTEDVYVRNLGKGTTKQASLLPGASRDVRGPILNGDISDDGRLVTFGNNTMLWVRDMAAKETIRFHHEPDAAPCQPVPTGSAGRPVLSGNGRYAAFSSCAEDLPGTGEVADVFRIDLESGKVQRVTAGDGHSYLPSLSRSGRYVGLGSEATDLVPGDTEGNPDAFVVDLVTGKTTRASQSQDGVGGNSWSASNSAAISGDGHTLVYQSYADNLVPGDESDFEEVFAWRDH